MNVLQKNISLLEYHIAQKNISKIPSNCGTMFILNYTKSCQGDKVWDDVTMVCRGIVVDVDYNIIAKSFPKFFNLFELEMFGATVDIANLSGYFEKYDGSNIIGFKKNCVLYTNTRGSWNTEYSKIANKMLLDSGENIIEGYTYIFELCVPSFDKMVVEYDKDFLVLLGMYDKDFNEIPYKQLKNYITKLDIAKEYKFDDLTFEQVLGLNTDNSEGFVVAFKEPIRNLNTDRMKLKFDDYVRKHFLKSKLSRKYLFELWSADKTFEGEVEEEFVVIIKSYFDEFDASYKKYTEDCDALIKLYSTVPFEVAFQNLQDTKYVTTVMRKMRELNKIGTYKFNKIDYIKSI
jgi:hypothetical protein